MSFTGGATLAAARVVLGVDSAQFSEGLRAAETEFAGTVGQMGGVTAELAERQLRTARATTTLTETLRKYSADTAQAMDATAGLVREQRRLVDVQAANRAEQTRFGSVMSTNTMSQRRYGQALGLTTNAFLGAAGLVYGIKTAIDASQRFQGEMRLLQTQALQTYGEVKRMTKGILEMAPAVAQGPDALSKGIYRVESAGIHGAAALKTLKIAALGARIGHADLEQTTLALVAAQKSGIDSTKSLGAKMGTLDAIVGAGSLRMEDLTAALASGVVPAAKQFGLGLADLGGALDVLTVQGVPAELAATRLRYTIALLGAQTSKAGKEMAVIGIHSGELGRIMRTQGLLPALTDLETKLRSSNLSIEAQNQLLVRAYGGGRSSTTVLTLIQNLDMLRGRIALIDKMGTSKSFQERVAAQKQTAEFAFAQLKAIAQVTEIRLGTALLPGVIKATTDVSHYLDKASTQKRLQHDVTQGFKDASEAAHVFGEALHQVTDVFHLLDRVLPGNLLRQLLEGFLLFKAANIAKGFNTAFLNPMRAFTGATKDAQAQLGMLESQLVNLPAEESAITRLQLGGAPRLYGQQRYTGPTGALQRAFSGGGDVVSGGSPVAAEGQAAAAALFSKPWERAPFIAQFEKQIAAEEDAAQAADLNTTATEAGTEAMSVEAKAATEDAVALTSLADAREKAAGSAAAATGALQRALTEAGAAAVASSPAAAAPAIPLAVTSAAGQNSIEQIAARYGLPVGEVAAMQAHIAGLSPTARLELGSGLSSLTNTPIAGGAGATAQEAVLLEGRLASLKAEQAYLADKYARARTDKPRARWAAEQAANEEQIAAARTRMGEIAPRLRQAALQGALGVGTAKTVPSGAGFAAGSNELRAGAARARIAYIGRGRLSETPFNGGSPHILRNGQWWRISEEEAATLSLPPANFQRYPTASLEPGQLYTPGPFYAGGRAEARAAEDAAAQAARGQRTITYQSGGRTITRTLSPQELEQARVSAGRLTGEAADQRKAADQAAGKAAREAERRASRQASLDEEAAARRQAADERNAQLSRSTQTRQQLEAQLAGLPKNVTARGGVAAARSQFADLQAARVKANRLLKNPELDKKFAAEKARISGEMELLDAQLATTPGPSQENVDLQNARTRLQQELKQKEGAVTQRAQGRVSAIDEKIANLPAGEAKGTVAEEVKALNVRKAEVNAQIRQFDAALQSSTLGPNEKAGAAADRKALTDQRATINTQLKDRQKLLDQYGPNATLATPQDAKNRNAERKALRERIAAAKEQEAADKKTARTSQQSAQTAAQSSRTYSAASQERSAASKRIVSGLEQEAIKTESAAAASQALVDQDAAAARAEFERASATSKSQAALEKLTQAQTLATDGLVTYQGLEGKLVAAQADEAAMLGDLTKQVSTLEESYGQLTVKQQLAREGLTELDSEVKVLTGDEEGLAAATARVNANTATIGNAAALGQLGPAAAQGSRIRINPDGTTTLVAPGGLSGGGLSRGLFGRVSGNSGEQYLLRRAALSADQEAASILSNVRGGLRTFGAGLRQRIGAAGTGEGQGQGAFGAGMLLTLFGPQIASSLPGGSNLGGLITGAGSGLIFGSMLGIKDPYLAAGVGASFGLRSAIGGSRGSTRSQIGSLFGDAAEGAGLGAVAGTLGGPLAPISVPVGAGIGAAAGLAIGGFKMLFNSSDETSKKLLGLANAAERAHSSVAGAKQGVLANQVSLANDRVNRDNARNALKAAQAAYEHAKGTKKEKEALDQLLAAEANYHAAQRQVVQDGGDIVKAHHDVTKAVTAEKEKNKELAAGIAKVADGFRNIHIGGFSSELTPATTKTQRLAYELQQSAGRVKEFAARMDDLAKKAQKTDPKLARTYRELAQIAENVKKIPSKAFIDVYVRTHLSGPSIDKSLQKELDLRHNLTSDAARQRAKEEAKAAREQAKTQADRRQQQHYVDPTSATFITHTDALIAEIQAGLRKGNVRHLEEEELRWLRNDYRRARTDAERSAIAQAITSLQSQMTSAAKSAVSNNGIGLVPQSLQDRYNKAFQRGDKGAELRALEAERRYLERLAARSHGAEHHKAEQLLNVIVGKIDRLIGVSSSSLVPMRDQLAVQKAIANMYRSKHGNVHALEQKRDLLLEYLKEPGHTRKQRDSAEHQLRQVQKQIRESKSQGGVIGVITALQHELRDLDRIANNPHKSLKTREQALAEENKVRAQIAAYEKKAFGVSGAEFLTSPRDMKAWLKLSNAYEKAKQTPGTADDIKALKAEQSYLQRVRDRLHGKAQEEANKLLASIDQKLQKLIQVSTDTQKSLEQTYLTDLASFFASFGSDVFTSKDGHNYPGSQGPTGGGGGPAGGGGGGGGGPVPYASNAGLTVIQQFPPGTENEHDRHAIYAKAAMQSQFD